MGVLVIGVLLFGVYIRIPVSGNYHMSVAFRGGCILEYIGNIAYMAGVQAERQRARDLCCRRGSFNWIAAKEFHYSGDLNTESMSFLILVVGLK